MWVLYFNSRDIFAILQDKQYIWHKQKILTIKKQNFAAQLIKLSHLNILFKALEKVLSEDFEWSSESELIYESQTCSYMVL